MYYLISAIILFLLGMIWEKSDWYNFFIKCALIGIACWGIFEFALQKGYVISSQTTDTEFQSLYKHCPIGVVIFPDGTHYCDSDCPFNTR